MDCARHAICWVFALFFSSRPRCVVTRYVTLNGISEHSAWQASLRWVANTLLVLLSIACVQKVVEISRD